jgi:NADH-quinone oxidoreductase subunit F
MTDLDLHPLRSLISPYAQKGRPGLLPALFAAQDLYGYIPEAAAKEISRELCVPLADTYGVIEFYGLFQSKPASKTVIHICNDPACAIAGSDELLKAFSTKMARQDFSIEKAPCLGLCDHAPALVVNNVQRGDVGTQKIPDILDEVGQKPYGIIGGENRIITINCGKRRTTTLAEYIESGGYAALKKALSLQPAEIITGVKDSGLVGRGGAAFPTGIKWEGAFKEVVQPKYVVCNADEAEPGTFKDRVLLEEDPHRIIEGLIICAFAVGAHDGYIFLRGEYTNAFREVTIALEAAKQAGYLGKNILGTGFDFDIQLFRGAGAYVCGEETALFEAIEGKRGFPRMKPPFPTSKGLFQKPTVINNVETLANITSILNLGATGYRLLGTEKSPGTKLFCLSGDVGHPGLYEVPFGVSLRHLIYDLAGGIRSGKSLKAILLGGAAGAFTNESALDVKLSFEDLRANGLPLGSGVVTVLDETRDIRETVLRIANFFANESCGKCYPCQIGTQRQLEIIRRFAEGKLLPGDKERLTDIYWTMTDASICGLGQTAASAVLSVLKLWPELFDELPSNY